MSLKTAAELICEHGPIRKFHKVYSGPGYPIDPKMEEKRMVVIPVTPPDDHWIVADYYEPDLDQKDFRVMAFPA